MREHLDMIDRRIRTRLRVRGTVQEVEGAVDDAVDLVITTVNEILAASSHA